MDEPAISLKGVCVEFPRENRAPIKAVSNIDLDVHEGEKIAVFGPNGSGKSTLLRVMAGLEKPSKGEISIFGFSAHREEPPSQVRRRIGFVFQNPEDVFATETVADEIRFILECRRPGLPVTDLDLKAILTEFHLVHLANRPLNRLSGGEKQLAALATVLAIGPEVVFFDEPTSYLDPPGRREFLRHPVLTEHRDKQTSVFVTQYWAEAKTCDRVLVLEQGNIIYDDPPSGYFPPDTPKPANLTQLDEDWLKVITTPPTDPMVLVENLTQTMSVFPGVPANPLRDVTFSIRSGERVGLVGPTGAGKSTLAYHLAGLILKSIGEISIAGQDVTETTGKNHRRPVALLFQNPDHHLFAETVAQDVAFGPRNMGFPRGDIASFVERSLAIAGLPAQEFGPRSPFEISAGEQRKVALAGTLAIQAAVYIFDEPTAYLDCQAAARVEALIQMLSARGKSIIVISHDLPFLRRVCPRWIILNRGRLIYDGSLVDLDQSSAPLQKIGFLETE